MHIDVPHTYFYYHLVAVLQCHFVLCTEATISSGSVKCSMWMIHIFADGGILFFMGDGGI